MAGEDIKKKIKETIEKCNKGSTVVISEESRVSSWSREEEKAAVVEDSLRRSV